MKITPNNHKRIKHMVYNEVGGRTVPTDLVYVENIEYVLCCLTREERADVAKICENLGWDYRTMHHEVQGLAYTVTIGNIKSNFASRKVASSYVKAMKNSYPHLSVFNREPADKYEVGIFMYRYEPIVKVIEPKFSLVTARNNSGRVASVYRRRN